MMFADDVVIYCDSREEVEVERWWRLKKIVGNKTKNWKKKPRIRIGNWNIGSLTGKERELVDVMQGRNIKILCIQETKWKGNSARKNMRRIQSVLCWRKYKEKC